MPPISDHTHPGTDAGYVAPQLTILGSVEALTLGGEGCDPEPSPFPGMFGESSPC
jgi:hypothetical protein